MLLLCGISPPTAEGYSRKALSTLLFHIDRLDKENELQSPKLLSPSSFCQYRGVKTSDIGRRVQDMGDFNGVL